MSYKRQRKENDYDQKITITKTTITKQINKNGNEDNNNNIDDEQDLNDVIKSFEYFDINHNGKVNISELKDVLSYFGDKMTDEEINRIFISAGIDPNSDGDIDYMKFINFFINNN